MNTNYKFLFLLIALLLIGCQSQKVYERELKEDKTSEIREEALATETIALGISIKDKDNSMVSEREFKGRVLAGTITQYLEFNKEDYDKAVLENKIILLNFYASWCHICKSEQKDAILAFDEMSYDNVVGFRVNYRDDDTDEFEEELAKEHGISYQHTKVIVKDGARVLKAPDKWSKLKYIEEIGKLL